jgi:cyclophilin family peptidyl-prolyl cis-trans isomerase/HEAT repeat protein
MKLLAPVCALLLLGQQSARVPVTPAYDIPADAVLTAEKAWAGADVLWPLAARDPVGAVRAIGRLEDPANVPRLLAMATSSGSAGAIADAVAQSLKGFDPQRDPGLIQSVSEWLRRVSFSDGPRGPVFIPGPIGRIAWSNPEQVHAAEDVLRRILSNCESSRERAVFYLGAARSLESLGRLNARVTTFDEDTVARLGRMVRNTYPNDDNDSVRFYAFSALAAGRALDPETEQVALQDAGWQLRRVAVSVLGGAGAGLDDDTRVDLIRHAMEDTSGQVRYEAVRAYARRAAATKGCAPIVDRLADKDSHVALAALDALGDACKQDDDITTRVSYDVRTPGASAWHREAHAFVALAKRSPERAAIVMGAFVTHPSWWVRMYAVSAAASASDTARLDKLAYDVNDNVREAALAPLRRLKKADADPAIVAALGRNDVQLLRTAALLLKESERNGKLVPPLTDALLRLTKGRKETSRDARMALLDAIAIHARAEDAKPLLPLLKDFDPRIAEKAALIVTQLTGSSVPAEPERILRGWSQEYPDPTPCVSVRMASGADFQIRLDATAAPITVDRFLKLALKDHYYDGLTIHRVVPNFVVQGGSPDANEYSGHRDYMRDEIGRINTRGSVGLSTRGRNTADAQFFINLVDNARLDYDYTIFGEVVVSRTQDGMAVVDTFEEGAVIRTIAPLRCAR